MVCCAVVCLLQLAKEILGAHVFSSTVTYTQTKKHKYLSLAGSQCITRFYSRVILVLTLFFRHYGLNRLLLSAAFYACNLTFLFFLWKGQIVPPGVYVYSVRTDTHIFIPLLFVFCSSTINQYNLQHRWSS